MSPAQSVKAIVAAAQQLSQPSIYAASAASAVSMEWPNLRRYNPLGSYPVEIGLMTPQQMEMPDDFISEYRQRWAAKTHPTYRQSWPQPKREAWERVEQALEQATGINGAEYFSELSMGYLHSWWFKHTVMRDDDVSKQTYQALSAQTSMMFIHQLQAAGVTDGDIMTVFGTFVGVCMDAYDDFKHAYDQRHPGMMNGRLTGVTVEPMFTFIIAVDGLYDRTRLDRDRGGQAPTTASEHLTALQRATYGYGAAGYHSQGDIPAVERVRQSGRGVGSVRTP